MLYTPILNVGTLCESTQMFSIVTRGSGRGTHDALRRDLTDDDTSDDDDIGGGVCDLGRGARGIFMYHDTQ